MDHVMLSFLVFVVGVVMLMIAMVMLFIAIIRLKKQKKQEILEDQIVSLTESDMVMDSKPFTDSVELFTIPYTLLQSFSEHIWSENLIKVMKETANCDCSPENILVTLAENDNHHTIVIRRVNESQPHNATIAVCTIFNKDLLEA